MNPHAKFVLFGAFICLLDAFALLFLFDSLAGFLMGGFGFVIGLVSSAILSEVK